MSKTKDKAKRETIQTIKNIFEGIKEATKFTGLCASSIQVLHFII